MKKIPSKNLIVKSNYLVEANYRLSAGEQKVLYKLITSINKDDEDFKKYKFRVSEFLELMDVKNSRKYEEIKKITYDLLGRKISIYDETEEKLIQATWLASAVYFNKKGEVELCFAPDLKPYLLQLKDCFTQFDIRNVMQLRSSYSSRIYELLKQYENIRERTFEVSDLRKKLGIEDHEYIKYNDFKRFVILQSQKEINQKTDIYFVFEEIKGTRKKVHAINFTIKPNNEATKSFFKDTTEVQTIDINKNTEIEDIIQNFKKKYNAILNLKLIEQLVSEKGFEYVKNCLEKYDDYICGNVKNIAGHFYKFVKDGYEKPINHKKNHLPYNMTNFRQREFTEEDFEDFFDKIGEEN